MLLDQLINLFVQSYTEKIPEFMGAIINDTLINKINSFANDFFNQQTCDNIKDPNDSQIDYPITITAFICS